MNIELIRRALTNALTQIVTDRENSIDDDECEFLDATRDDLVAALKELDT
jgi:hypothetical protein